MIRTIEDQVQKTYFSLRVSAAVIAFTFPVLLWVGGLCAGFSLRDSMSAYYHATPTSLEASKAPCAPNEPTQNALAQAGVMRNWFVGLLFAIGAILHANKGHTERENWALSLAGFFAVGIALIPMPWACKPESSISPHGICAMSFFGCIAFVSLVCSRDTVQLLKPGRQGFYRNLYWVWGGLMVVAPAAAYVLNTYGSHTKSAIFWAELSGIYAFGLYWVTKTFEIKEIQKDQSAREGFVKPSALKIA